MAFSEALRPLYDPAAFNLVFLKHRFIGARSDPNTAHSGAQRTSRVLQLGHSRNQNRPLVKAMHFSDVRETAMNKSLITSPDVGTERGSRGELLKKGAFEMKPRVKCVWSQ